MSIPARKTAIISSTAADLPDHRKQAFDACLRQSVFPDGMEHLPAQDATGIKASLDMVNRADIYIGIYAHRYGWIPTDETVAKAEKELNTKLDRGISITEMEFNRAVERGIPILVFTISENHALTIQMVETGDLAQTKLAALKNRAAGENRIRAKFDSPTDLRAHIIQALAALQAQTASGDPPPTPQFHPLNIIPKPPEPYIAHPYSLLQTKNVIGRQAELNLLTDWVTRNQTVPADTRIFNLVAIGGMGKSALTWKWFNDIAPKELPRLAGRMWWSFYESDAYFENFIIRALAYTSARPEEEIRKLNPLDRENQLFHLLDTKPFLLVLDGLERILIAYARLDAAQMLDDDLDEKTKNFLPLGRTGAPPVPVGAPPTESTHTNATASPSAPDHPASESPITTQPLPESAADSFYGKHHLRRTADHRAGQFLRRLARIQQSRILITTRLYPTELQADTGDPLPGCHAQFLCGLTDSDALNLWRAFNVTGSTDQLLPLFRSFGNYPLLIRALAGEIASYRPAPRDFDKWRAANPNFNPVDLPLINAKTHVLEYALRALSEAQRKVLHTIAAFRMPATWDTLRALFVDQPPPSQNPGGTRSTRVPNSPDGTRPPKTSEGDSKDALRPATSNPGISARIANPKPCASDQSLDRILTDLEDRGLVGWDRISNRYDLHPIVRSVAWQKLRSASRKKILGHLCSHFEALPKPTHDAIRSLDDLTPSIELYRSLLGMNRPSEALAAFFEHLDDATDFRLSASRFRVELLEPLVEAGVSQAVLGYLHPKELYDAFNALGRSYLYAGRITDAIRCFDSAIALCEQSPLLSSPHLYCLSDLSNAKRVSGDLFGAMKAALTAVHMTQRLGSSETIARIMARLGLTLAVLGSPKEAKTVARRALRIASVSAEIQSIGFICFSSAQQSFWIGELASAKKSLQLASSYVHKIRFARDLIRFKRLYGETSLALDDRPNGERYLNEAVLGARAVHFTEEELPILTALAELHRRKNEHSTARELLDQVWDPAERGPYPLFIADALNVLAQIERDQGNTPAAIAAATKAYTLAWCDGISADGTQCYAYHYGLTNARKHLEELGAPVPQLPPFDESKFEPLPDVELNPKDQFWVDPDTLDSLD